MLDTLTIQALHPCQRHILHSILSLALDLGWSCVDIYETGLGTGLDNTAILTLCRELDRYTTWDRSDTLAMLYEDVKRWQSKGPVSPSLETIRELVGKLTPVERQSLLVLLTDDDVEDYIRFGESNRCSIGPVYEGDTWMGYQIHTDYGGSNSYMVWANPGKYNDVELLIKALRQTVPPSEQLMPVLSSHDLHSGMAGVFKDLRDRLDVESFSDLATTLDEMESYGPFVWAYDCAYVELRQDVPGDSGKYTLYIGANKGLEAVDWILSYPEAREFTDVVVAGLDDLWSWTPEESGNDLSRYLPHRFGGV